MRSSRRQHESPIAAATSGHTRKGRERCAPGPLLTVVASQAAALHGCRNEGVDALLVVTAWDEFSSPDYAALRQLLRSPVIIDGRNIYDPEFMKSEGFVYLGIGRGEII